MSQLTVCIPMCGCGATSSGFASVKERGPKRSRKHHAPTSRFCRIGSALRIVNEPRLVSCAGNLSITGPCMLSGVKWLRSYGRVNHVSRSLVIDISYESFNVLVLQLIVSESLVLFRHRRLHRRASNARLLACPARTKWARLRRRMLSRSSSRCQ